MARPRLFSFFQRAPDASALVPPPFSVTTGLQSEPPLTVTSKQIADPAAEIVSLGARLASVTAERDIALAANGALSAKVAEFESAIAALKAEAAALNQSLTDAIAERDGLKAESARTRADLTQEIRNTELATLAASQGVPAGAEIVPANGPGKSKTDELEEVIAEIKASKDPAQKGILAVKASNLRADIRAGK